jgi:hypothetical protein
MNGEANRKKARTTDESAQADIEKRIDHHLAMRMAALTDGLLNNRARSDEPAYTRRKERLLLLLR